MKRRDGGGMAKIKKKRTGLSGSKKNGKSMFSTSAFDTDREGNAKDVRWGHKVNKGRKKKGGIFSKIF